MERLKNIRQAKGVTLFALIDHSGEAEKVGMKMPPTKLLIFGSPKAGTPLPAGDSWRRVAHYLFPLMSEEQKKYDFRPMGQEILRGRDAYHIGFVPKDKNTFTWTGEAFIDATDFQLARVFTTLSRHVPFVVRTVLGRNTSGIGYDLEYKPQEDGTWFPTSYGTEYELHLFFHINPTVSVSMDASFEHVRKTTVSDTAK